jgi:preprotein translocase subunit Sss1
LSSGTKFSFVIGAIGGFLIALLEIPAELGWTWDDVPWDEPQFFLILTLAGILISIGFFGLWRKSGNVIPLVTAICIIVFAITNPLQYYLVTYTTLLPVWLPEVAVIGRICRDVGWITAGISAWLLREEFSPFSFVAALVFLAFGAVGFLTLLIALGDLWYWFFIATGIVAGIYFLDAART